MKVIYPMVYVTSLVQFNQLLVKEEVRFMTQLVLYFLCLEYYNWLF